MPADDVRGNFIADAVGQHAGMAAATPGSLAHQPPRFFLDTTAFQKAQVLGPGNVDEQRQPLFIRQVQKPLGRQMVGADGINAAGVHEGEIFPNTLRGRKRLSPVIRRERTIRHALDSKAGVAARKKLSIQANPARDTHPIGVRGPVR